MLIFFGTRGNKIGTAHLEGISCPHCNSTNTLSATKYGRYFHIFFIPIFPTSSRTIIECSHCYKSYDGDSFLANNDKKEELIPAKRPIWHSCGCLLIFLLIAFSLVTKCTASLFGGNHKEEESKKDNPAYLEYKKDYAKMSSKIDCKTDSVSCAVREGLSLLLTDELHPDTYEYFSKIKDNKVLILVKIDEMKKIESSERKQFIDLIKKSAQLLDNMEDKQYYIGVDGRWNMVLVYTPYGSDLGGRFADDSYLLNFYKIDKIIKN